MDQKGTALLSCLLFALLFASLSTALLQIALLSKERNAVGAQVVSNTQSQNKAIIDLVEGTAPLSDSTLRCFINNSESIKLCKLLPSTSLPLINFSFIFKEIQPCRKLKLPSALVRSAHFAMFKSCSIENTTSPKASIYAENIEAVTQITLRKATPESPVLMASGGAIVVTAPLLLTDDTLLIAGGDITLSEIRSIAGRAIRVSLYSARGEVQVQSIDSSVRVTARSRLKVSLPANAVLDGDPFLPPTLKQLVVGVVTN